MHTTVIEWDGTHLPDGLRELPPGRYLVDPLDHSPTLAMEEDAAIREGLDQLARGETLTHAEVWRDLQGGFKRE